MHLIFVKNIRTLVNHNINCNGLSYDLNSVDCTTQNSVKYNFMVLPIDKILAKKLRTLRLQHDLPQKFLAEKLNLRNQQNYSLLERGLKHFSEDLVLCVCKVFNISKYNFLDMDLSPEQLNHEQPETENVGDHLKTIVGLKSEIIFYQNIVSILYSKLLIEKEIQIVNLELDKARSAIVSNHPVIEISK